MLSRRHWSYSRVAQYLRCPRQYFFERVLGWRRRSIPSTLAFGSAVHEALAEHHRALMKGTSHAPDRVRNQFITTWKRIETDTPIDQRNGETPRGLIDEGLACLEAYLREPAPRDVCHVERELAVPLEDLEGEWLSDPLVSVLDLVCQPNDTLSITEFKTSSRRYPVSDLSRSLQARCYLHAASTYFGDNATVEFVVIVRATTPFIQRLPFTARENDSRQLGELVRNVERAIAAEAFYPVESDFNCAACPFRAPCRDAGPAIHAPTSQETTGC